jgi:hypothetical protein
MKARRKECRKGPKLKSVSKSGALSNMKDDLKSTPLPATEKNVARRQVGVAK